MGDAKKTITIFRDNFGPDVEEFSTTTVVSRMATQVVLMDMVKQYLDYRVRTQCGIPKFHVKGSPEDWAKMLKKIQAFRKFNLEWWVNGLEQILSKFLNIVSGKSSEKSFLKSLYKFQMGSGGYRIDGEVIKLFPYLKNYQGEFQKCTQVRWGVGSDSFPSGKSDVPFVWDCLGKKRVMHFHTFCVPVLENGCIAVKPVVQVIENRFNSW